MLNKLHAKVRTLWIAMLIMASPAAFSIDYIDSSLGRFQAYVEPWINSNGKAVGIEVHYSLGQLYDQYGQPSHYAAVCVKQGYVANACLEHDARVWTKNTSYYYIGYWVTQYVPLDCNSGLGYVQVHQPYTYSGSSLNFSLYGGSPYRGSLLFYSGTSDVANVQFTGCRQIAR